MDTRSGEKLVQLSKKEMHLTCLPIIEKFQHTKLSLLKEVISLVYKRTEEGYTFESAVKHLPIGRERLDGQKHLYIFEPGCFEKAEQTFERIRPKSILEDKERVLLIGAMS